MFTLDSKTEIKLGSLLKLQNPNSGLIITDEDVRRVIEKSTNVKVLGLHDCSSIGEVCSTIEHNLPKGTNHTTICFIQYNNMKVSDYNILSEALLTTGGKLMMSLLTASSGTARPSVTLFLFTESIK